ncbi:MAG: phenylalanine--tRNA ligase subunit alpha, partial [Deltaproteobacteria bacterium]
MKDELLELRKEALQELKSVAESSDIERLRRRYLGRKGLLTLLSKRLAELPKQQRPAIGKIVNQVKEELRREFQAATDSLTAKAIEGVSA